MTSRMRFSLPRRIHCIAHVVAFGIVAVAPLVLAVDGGENTVDPRPTTLVHLRSSDFPFVPPVTVKNWEQRSKWLRRQVQVATGQWPPPPRTAPQAQIYGRVERPDFTVERVHFESVPGHFVTGSLFRPKRYAGRRPAVLSPHGHWQQGRFQDWGSDEVRRQIATGAERYEAGGRHIIQSRAVQLARMGCVVFVYDLLGYADSQQLSEDTIHRPDASTIVDDESGWGFYSTRAELRLQSPLALQLHNGRCALDWLLSLDDVDPQRIAVVGGSGGATQTLLLGVVDPRPTVFFPAVMVSTSMQGGCGCENACGLRVNTGNVEFAALLAPKPLGMTSADDWTRDFGRKGFPELQQLYALMGAKERVELTPLTQFPHNFNYPSRAAMYAWLNRWLDLGQAAPIVEGDYQPLTRSELSVWNTDHPRPTGGREHEAQLLQEWAEQSDRQLRAYWPTTQPSLQRYREFVGQAFEAILNVAANTGDDLEIVKQTSHAAPHYVEQELLIINRRSQAHLPARLLTRGETTKRWVVWISPRGKSTVYQSGGAMLHPSAQRLLDAGSAVLLADLYYQGDLLPENQNPSQDRLTEGNRPIAPLTFGYNRTATAQRASDVITLLATAKSLATDDASILLLGEEGSAAYVASAAALATADVDAIAICSGGFRFEQVQSWRDFDFLPGALKYGDVPAMLALASPTPLWIGEPTTPDLVRRAYVADQAGDVVVAGGPSATLDAAIDFLLQH